MVSLDSGSVEAILECLNNLPLLFFSTCCLKFCSHVYECMLLHVWMHMHMSKNVRVCHLCWHCSPHLPIWQLVIDWLLNAPFTHMCTHTNTERKVHYTSMSGSVLIVMGDRCKVLGSTTLTHTYTHNIDIHRHNLFYTHTRKDKLTLGFLPLLISHMHTFLSISNYRHTHTHPWTVQYPFNVLSCSWQQWSEVSLRRVGKKVSCPLH